MVVARTQTLVQLSDGLVARLDAKAAKLRRSRSSLVREALEQYLHSEIEAEIDRKIVEGYTRVPQTGDGLESWADRAARELIAEEPW